MLGALGTNRRHDHQAAQYLLHIHENGGSQAVLFRWDTLRWRCRSGRRSKAQPQCRRTKTTPKLDLQPILGDSLWALFLQGPYLGPSTANSRLMPACALKLPNAAIWRKREQSPQSGRLLDKRLRQREGCETT